MAAGMDKLRAALAGDPFARPVYYIASTEAALLREAGAEVIRALEAAGDADVTRIDGPSPDMGDIIGAAGAISFFGTPRVVELREISPAAMGDKAVDELCELFGDLENAVLVITALYKDKKAIATKKAKKLLETAGTIGVAAELQKPGRADTLRWLEELAAAEGAGFQPGAAAALYDRVGDDRVLLASETAKLCAVCGYRSISVKAVEYMSVPSIEADVFELVRLLVGGNAAVCYAKLNDLLALRHEPIAIAAALAGSYVDMYRAACGRAAGRSTAAIFQELGYKGNDYRMKKADENARRYTPAALERCIECLAELDLALKSSALADKSVLLQAAVGELVMLGGRR